MKILIVTNYFPPYSRGGGEEVARLSADGFAALGHQVVIATSVPKPYLKGEKLSKKTEAGIDVYRWFPFNFYYLQEASQKPAWLRMLWTLVDMVNLHSWWVMRKVLREEQPDLIISHNLKGMGFLLPRLLASQSKGRYIHVLHDVQLVEPSGLLFPETLEKATRRLPTRVHASLMRWLFATTPIVVSPSHYLLDFYRERKFFQLSKMWVVMNPSSGETHAKKNHDEVVIGYIGELSDSRGFSVLLEAWRQTTNPTLRLLVSGSGELTKEVTRLTEQDDRIEVVEPVSGLAPNSMWEEMDILVKPSRCLENSPTVIQKAMQQGVWVVATEVGGIPEFKKAGSGIVCVPPGDSQALRVAIEQTVQKVKQGERPARVSWPDSRAYATRFLEFAKEVLS